MKIAARTSSYPVTVAFSSELSYKPKQPVEAIFKSTYTVVVYSPHLSPGENMRRRSTLHITLVLIGTLAATGCSKKEERHVYTNKQDCLDDWNNDPQKCEEVGSESSHYRSNAHYFYGPWYRSGTVFSGGQGSRAIRGTSVSRGGFGSLGGFHSSGG
jgi:uncharacterized protein YgiB involved in biofilm formation